MSTLFQATANFSWWSQFSRPKWSWFRDAACQVHTLEQRIVYPLEAPPGGLTLWEKHLLPISSAFREPFGDSKAKLGTATPFISFMPPGSPYLHTFEQCLEDGHVHILLTRFALSENGQELPAPYYVLDLQGKPWAGNEQQHLLLCGAAPGSPWVICSPPCLPAQLGLVPHCSWGPSGSLAVPRNL